MSSSIHFLVPEEQTRGLPPPPQPTPILLLQLAGCLNCSIRIQQVRRSARASSGTMLKFQCVDVCAEMEFHFSAHNRRNESRWLSWLCHHVAHLEWWIFQLVLGAQWNHQLRLYSKYENFTQDKTNMDQALKENILS